MADQTVKYIKNIIFALIFFPHSLKISMSSVNHGLSYSFKRNQSLNSKFTHQLPLLSLYLTSLCLDDDSENDFLLKSIFINKHFSNLIPVTCQNFKKYLNKVSGDEGMVLKMLSVWQQNMMLCKFWFWPPNVF